jgi:hypothetical protein
MEADVTLPHDSRQYTITASRGFDGNFSFAAQRKVLFFGHWHCAGLKKVKKKPCLQAGLL